MLKNDLSTDGQTAARVLFLGTYHFANPGHDVVKIEVADILSPEKQQEVEQVVEALSTFSPTKIAVEVLPDAAEQLNDSYKTFRISEHELSPSEVEQLGFRLASRFSHSSLYAINHFNDFPYEALIAYARENDRAFIDYIERMTAEVAAEENRRQQTLSIGQNLRLMNDPQTIAAEHGIYMQFAKVGAGDTYIGANLVAKWYERNLHSFSNLQKIAQPGDRIIVLYGSGHAATLREFIAHAPDMALVDTRDYLPAS